MGLAEVPSGVLCGSNESDAVVYITERTERDYNRIGEGYPIDSRIIEYCNTKWGVDEILLVEEDRATYAFAIEQYVNQIPDEEHLDPIVPLRYAKHRGPPMELPSINVGEESIVAVSIPEKYRDWR